MSRSSLALMQLLFWLSYLHHFRSSSAASCGDDDGDEHGLDDYDGDDGGSLHLMLFLTLGMSTVGRRFSYRLLSSTMLPR